jgi:hypothetical protein
MAGSKAGDEVAHGDQLIARMTDLNKRAEKILKTAEKAGDGQLALKAIMDLSTDLADVGQ